MTTTDWLVILPVLVLSGWALTVLLVDLWIPAKYKFITPLLTVLGLAATLGLSLSKFGSPQSAFDGMVVVDGFAVFLDFIFLVSGLGAVALAYRYLRRMEIERCEYYSLLMFAISGMMLMTYANDLVVVFLALELLSIPLYVLAGFVRMDLLSEEAALKYFLLGAFSSGFVLYGIGLIFGATAHTQLPAVAAAVSGGASVNLPMFIAGAALLLVGFGFKQAAVPFHMWSPDVYQGAPSSVTAFMSIGAKAAGFAALMRVFVAAFPSLSADMSWVLWALAALTMIVGNVIAIAQTNIKRLLAYSSIAQTGYLLMAFVPYGDHQVLSDTIAAMLFYLLAYMLTTLGAWAVIIAVEKAGGEGLELKDYAGLGRKHPLLGAAMTIFMVSLVGVPPTLGFWGKFYLFRTAVEGGYTGLALIGLLTSLVSAYYYLRVVVIMYMQPGEPETADDLWLRLVALTCAAAVVLLAFVPWSVLSLVLKAALQIL
jgi:NADH-quinone oxidoreductase subunit N